MENKCSQEPATNKGVFQNKKTKGYLNMNLEMLLQMLNMCKW